MITPMNLQGIFAPLTTPFAPSGEVDYAAYAQNIARFNKTKLAGYVINGSTSESVLLRWSEVYRQWEVALEHAAAGKELVAGTGAEFTIETIAHTNHAASLGYKAALVRTPSFYKPAMTEDALVEHYLRVADAAKIPILVYSVPIFTHVTVEAPVVARTSKHPNIIGIKDSSGNVEALAASIAAAPKEFKTLVGSASALYEALQVGATGAILAIANAFPDLCADIYALSRSGSREKAHALAQALTAPAKMFGPQYGIAGLKYAMDRNGYIGGPTRLPLLPLTDAARREIDAMLSNLGAQAVHQT
jgi:4-hydroxy-2-oxoglutarate aldolase